MDKKSSSEADKQKGEDEAAMVPPARCTLAAPSLSPIVIDRMEEMFLRFGFNEAVVLKLVDDQGIDSLQTIASLSYEDITIIYDVIRWPGG